MIDIDTSPAAEPEFWTILKTPCKQKEDLPAYIMMCDGFSTTYTFQHYSKTPTVAVTVVGNNIIGNHQYSVKLAGSFGHVYFESPPAAGTVISIYIHE